MASVAICPHCYLQLVVPDGVEPDERVECPTCAKEFGLDQAVLRPIPEIVRCSQTAPAVTPVADLGDVVEGIDEIVIEEKIVELPQAVERGSDDEAARYVEEIKARIESELAAGGLPPGSGTSLSLATPEPSLKPVELEESIPAADAAEDPLAAFRNAKTVAEFSAFSNEIEQPDEISFDLEVDGVAERADELIANVEETDEAADELASEPIESRVPQPTVRTLADWMQPREELPKEEPIPEPLAAEIEAEVEEVAEEVEAALGPSFDLPNVPLVPNNGATVEFDQNMSFGPAGETEFELDDVNFESVSAEEPMTNEFSEEVAEESEPVFPESKGEMPAAPFVLPGVSRQRKKRSVVRVLVGTALGGVVGILAAGYILLWLLGPDGDLLHIAKYIPSAALPKSFQASAPIVAVNRPVTPSEETAPATTEVASDEGAAKVDESANVPAGYVEETPADSGVVATTESDDDRYGTEPAPLDEPAAKPIEQVTPLAAAPAAPLQGPTFTVDELAKKLEAGKAAQAGLLDGDLSDAAVRRTKGASYEKLAELAEALTFVDTASPSIESEDATNGAVQVFNEVFSNLHTRDEIARIVSVWIPSSHRKNSGVFVAGTAQGGQIAGEVYEYQISTEAGGKLTLLSREPLESSLADSSRPIGFVGAIVDHPVENVTGYQGTAERAIWLTRAIPLD